MNISRSISQLRETIICTSKDLTFIETTLYQNDFVSKRLVSKQLCIKTTVIKPCEKQLQFSKQRAILGFVHSEGISLIGVETLSG